MNIFRAQQRLVSWIASMAILLAIFAPMLASAQGSGQSVSWIQLCSAHGSKWISVDIDHTDGAPSVPVASVHCPGCVGHVPPMAPPPALIAIVVLDLKPAYPPVFFSTPRTLYAWTHAHARAPPRLS